MIDPRELRIENLVMLPKTKFRQAKSIKVETIGGSGINVQSGYEGSIDAEYYWVDICGIPLTEDILLRYGFVKTDNENEDCYRYGSGGYEIWGNGKEDGSDNGFYHINDAFIIYLDFLHQLQNFHFINTGEELKYNP